MADMLSGEQGRRFWWRASGVAAAVIVLDALTKLFFWRQLVAGNTQFWRWQFLHLTGQLNWGVAFSLPLMGGWLAVVLAVALPVLAWFIYAHLRHDSWRAIVAGGFLLGGAVGNLLTRFLLGGAVLDFIGIGLFPLFNLADSAITLGGLMLVLFWRQIVR